jgi:cytidylate kinase
MTQGGAAVSLPNLQKEIARRDAFDSSRLVSPLIPAPDAVLLDTSDKSPREVIEEVLSLVRSRLQDR